MVKVSLGLLMILRAIWAFIQIVPSSGNTAVYFAVASEDLSIEKMVFHLLSFTDTAEEFPRFEHI